MHTNIISPWKFSLSIEDRTVLENLARAFNEQLELAQASRNLSLLATLKMSTGSKIYHVEASAEVLAALEIEFKHAGWATARATNEYKNSEKYVYLSLSFGLDDEQD